MNKIEKEHQMSGVKARTKARVEVNQLDHEVKLSYRKKTSAAERPFISSSTDAADYLRTVWEPCSLSLYECFYVILLTRQNRVKAWVKISQGGLSGTVADSKLILCCALKALCSNIILAHNHPSGNMEPSKADQRLTERLKAGAKLIDINVLDHIILTEDNHYSFADSGVM